MVWREAREAFRRARSLVERELGAFWNPPRLTTVEQQYPEELEPEPWEPSSIVAAGYPAEGIVVYSKHLPRSVPILTTLFLHELAEIRFRQMGFGDAHDRASEFTERHYAEVGGLSPFEVDVELASRGYFHTFVYGPERVIRAALSQLPLPLPPPLESLLEKRRRALAKLLPELRKELE